MRQYTKGEQVTVTAKHKGKMTQVTGEVFFVIQVDRELQCLTIYGTSANGDSIRTKTYNDDQSLQTISSQLKATA